MSAEPDPDEGRRDAVAPAGGASRRDAALVEHREEILRIAAASNATAVALVGSMARSEDTERSDFDFLVNFAAGTTLLDVAHLQIGLEELLGTKVDVISRGALTERHSDMLKDAIDLGETPDCPSWRDDPAGAWHNRSADVGA
ncbi:nucleotidyltransferase family protein [Candidatus Poriferisodalis sp.]|uniref:nucleotidyltransferase family protein n=1 Tax=Candidatus Poriferisodalis sp. TaxID=3101277 RepID=UPI003B02E607